MNRFPVRLFAAVMLFSPAALAEETPRALVVVDVFNGAGVTESVLAEAGREVRKIFDEIGVRVSWEVTYAFRTSDPPLTTKTEARAAEVAVNIIPKPMADFPSDVRRNPADERMSIWSPDSSRIVFNSLQGAF